MHNLFAIILLHNSRYFQQPVTFPCFYPTILVEIIKVKGEGRNEKMAGTVRNARTSFPPGSIRFGYGESLKITRGDIKER